jgi:hypothetical protein
MLVIQPTVPHSQLKYGAGHGKKRKEQNLKTIHNHNIIERIPQKREHILVNDA